ELVAGLALEAIRASKGAAYDCYRALLAAAPELRNDRALLQDGAGPAASEWLGAGNVTIRAGAAWELIYPSQFPSCAGGHRGVCQTGGYQQRP
ncbi:unnamed protein product, partial [Prorocentrum cordatum]